MSAKPAEIYERLKDLRRQGDGTIIRSKISEQIEIVRLGERISVAEMHRVTDRAGTEILIRALEIKTLAYRVFGDEQKAESWLQRPNGSLSGQKPVDLLNDELGTAVVREMLERIDHGIFA
jgi:putative toxin-antitoxin system antitoxin component (TIGR02293 family)